MSTPAETTGADCADYLDVGVKTLIVNGMLLLRDGLQGKWEAVFRRYAALAVYATDHRNSDQAPAQVRPGVRLETSSCGYMYRIRTRGCLGDVSNMQ